MKRGSGKKALIGLIMMALIGFAGGGGAQDTAPDLATDGEVTIKDPTADLETMGLIWIQEGQVKRLAYVVQTGDTMWDIAGRYLNSNYYWPKIWERNSFIINPHLIFPGDILYIYPEGLIERPAYDMGADSSSVGAYGRRPKIIYPTHSSTGFIGLEELEKAGKIVDNRDRKALLGENDIIYVDVGKVDRVEPGDRYSLFRIKEDLSTGDFIKVTHPVTGELIGYQFENLGEMVITKPEIDVSEGIIENSYQEARTGDYITPYYQPLGRDVELVGAELEQLHAYIVADKTGTKIIGENDVVYIDVGAEDGVMRGNSFVVYEPCEIIIDEITESKIRIPEKILGTIVVLEPKTKTSTCLVTDALREMAIGDRVFTSRYGSWEIEGVSHTVDINRCKNDPTCRLITAEEYEQGMDYPYCERPIEEYKKDKKWQKMTYPSKK